MYKTSLGTKGRADNLVAGRKHYAKAPITEALIDIQVRQAAGSGLSILEPLFEKVREQYPNRKTRVSLEGRFSAGAEVAASAKQTHDGYIFSSEDGRQVFQARLDGFTFSRLHPYESWERLRDEARRLWGVYREQINPDRMTRVAVRYINRIDMPLPVTDFRDYLRTVPDVSPELPQGLSGFFMQLQFPQADFQGLVVLTETTVPSSLPSVISVILDIDVFKPEADLVYDEEAWEMLELMRKRKNQYFEACISDRARELFEPLN